MNTRICIIRHGETDWNREKRIQGHIDTPLNTTGHPQAKAMTLLAGHHPFSSIYSSDLSRALKTAFPLAQRYELAVQLRPDLRERHYGILQGMAKDDVKTNNPEAYALYTARDMQYDFENGESLTAFAKRVRLAFDDIARRHCGETVAVICHAGLLDVMYREAIHQPLHTPRGFSIPNCVMNWFHRGGNYWHLDAWNDHQYLTQEKLNSMEFT